MNESAPQSQLKKAIYSKEEPSESPQRVLCNRMQRADRQQRLMNKAKGVRTMI